MTIHGKLKEGVDVAVFVRNHPGHLRDALRILREHPERLITFRAARKWAGAAAALARKAPLALYIAPIGDRGMVEYVAELQQVVLAPRIGDPVTDRLLTFTTSTTAGEGLRGPYGTHVKTLYAMSNCRAIAPFPMTALIKVADGKPIRPDYRYSYSIVYAVHTLENGEAKKAIRGRARHST